MTATLGPLLAVYPRGCGELLTLCLRLSLRNGLSPWVRGTHHYVVTHERDARFIPVGAGNSFTLHHRSPMRTVYPRGCGELAYNLAGGYFHIGLSPWVRGTRQTKLFLGSSTRFIPVGAGNSLLSACSLALSPVYPRGCGELLNIDLFASITGGLSPWVRGTQHLKKSQSEPCRFIPVGAGNSYSAEIKQIDVTVYPRGCGELLLNKCSLSSSGGLSPWVRGTPSNYPLYQITHRFIPVGAGNSHSISDDGYRTLGLSPWVRGTLMPRMLKRLGFRFIPVGAGNSTDYSRPPHRWPVYPRGCGELFYRFDKAKELDGLSPWVRGTRRWQPCALLHVRFIPVGAGNSEQTQMNPNHLTVYPRGCGELSTTTASAKVYVGLSPWVRGTQLINPISKGRVRFIPVGAGNSSYPGRC